MQKVTLPHRAAILDLLTSQTRALHAREIAARLHVEDASYPGLLSLLDDLAFSGAISPMAGQRFRAAREAGGPRGAERQGVLSVHPRGFGFVASIGYEDDLYVPEEALGGAMHGDIVKARLVARSQRGSEGEIVAVEKRANARVVGVLRRRGKGLWLEPDDTRLRGPIVLSGADIADARDGDAAVAKITRFPEVPRETPEAVLEGVLGVPGDPNVEVAKILAREAVEEEHPAPAVREAESYGREVAADALVHREDLTHLPMPTIDPEDARDHDDAVWGQREADGSYTVWIAIADVSHYVRPGTELDAAALARGCSIYLPDRAIPMLPRSLSSHLCSL
jgi:ribonuclease R